MKINEYESVSVEFTKGALKAIHDGNIRSLGSYLWFSGNNNWTHRKYTISATSGERIPEKWSRLLASEVARRNSENILEMLILSIIVSKKEIDCNPKNEPIDWTNFFENLPADPVASGLELEWRLAEWEKKIRI